MKIAVCYRGHLRTLSKTFENQKEQLFQDHEVDFFCHTWNQYPDEIDFLKNVVKPKKLLVETPKSFEFNPYNSIEFNSNNINLNSIPEKTKKIENGYLQSMPYNVLSMMYSLHQVNIIRKEYSQINNINYDSILVIRPDIYFYDKFLYNEVDLKKINISWYENIGDHLNNPLAIIDHIALSSVRNIEVYCDCFLYIPFYYFNKSVPFVHETLLGSHVMSNQININMINARHKVIRIENYKHYDNLDR
jgi:hypothetical protein